MLKCDWSTITSLSDAFHVRHKEAVKVRQKNTTKQKSTGILLDTTVYRDRGWGLNSTSKCYASIPWQARPSTLSRTLWNSLLVLPWIQWLQFWCNVQNKTWELLVYIMCRYFDALRSPSVQIWTYPSGAAMKTLHCWETGKQSVYSRHWNRLRIMGNISGWGSEITWQWGHFGIHVGSLLAFSCIYIYTHGVRFHRKALRRFRRHRSSLYRKLCLRSPVCRCS